MEYATMNQINSFEQENNVIFLYRATDGLHFRDIQDKSHYIKDEREIIEGGY